MNSEKQVFNPVQTTPFATNVKLKSYLWKIINYTVFRLFPPRFKWHRVTLLRAFGAKIASNVTIHGTAIIDFPWNLSIGKLSSLGDRSWIYCLAPIIIGEKCCIGKDVYLITGTHDITDINFKLVTKPIIINDCCWVATGAYILPGVVLGEHSVIAAKSVVTKTTESHSVVGGNPAKFLKKRQFRN